MKKWVVLGLVLVSPVGWFAFRSFHAGPSPSAAPANTARIERKTIDVAVEAVGEINPANTVTVKSEVNGRVKDVLVVAGQAVVHGAVLLTLDDTDLLTERDAVQTQIAGAELQLQKARRDAERLRDLFRDKLVSQETVDNAKTTLDLAQNEHDKARKQLQLVEDKLKKILILAPFDGTVLTVSVTRGQAVSGTSGVSQGTELMTFADLNTLLIKAHINQVDVAKVRPDHEAEITIDSLADVILAGRVNLIAPVATVKNGIKGFDTDVLITRGNPQVRPGMTANLRFAVAHLTNTVAVPLSAVFADGNRRSVFVQTNNAAERRSITLGLADENNAQVLGGLQEGDVVLLERPPAR